MKIRITLHGAPWLETLRTVKSAINRVVGPYEGDGDIRILTIQGGTAHDVRTLKHLLDVEEVPE